MMQLTANTRNNLLSVLVIFLLVTTYIITGYLTLEEDSRRVPLLTGYVIYFLLGLEIFKTIQGGNKTIDARPSPPEEAPAPIPIKREITAVLYVGGLVLGIYFVGFLAAIPVYLLTAMSWLGGQSLRLALLISIPASVAIYVIFEVLLEYRLFQGVLF